MGARVPQGQKGAISGAEIHWSSLAFQPGFDLFQNAVAFVGQFLGRGKNGGLEIAAVENAADEAGFMSPAGAEALSARDHLDAKRLRNGPPQQGHPSPSGDQPEA